MDKEPVTLQAIAGQGSNFRFYDNRQKYLMFVNTCSEKWVIAQRVAKELETLSPAPPALRFFDAGVGDGTVLARVLRSLHRQFERVPFYVGAKEISLEDIRLTLDLDGGHKVDVDTGIPFFDHMLHQLGFHGHLDLGIKAGGDIDVACQRRTGIGPRLGAPGQCGAGDHDRRSLDRAASADEFLPVGAERLHGRIAGQEGYPLAIFQAVRISRKQR